MGNQYFTLDDLSPEEAQRLIYKNLGSFQLDLNLHKELKKLNEEIMTTTNQADKQEADAIVKLLDNYVVFDKPDNERFIGKPGLALSVIIELLVSKGSLTLQDVERFLVGKAK